MEKQTERLRNLKEKGLAWMEKRKAMSNGSGKERAEKTVRGRIFVTNAWMIRRWQQTGERKMNRWQRRAR